MIVSEILILADRQGLFERSEDALVFISTQYFNLGESYEPLDMALDYTCLYLNPQYRYEGYHLTFDEKIDFLLKQRNDWSSNFLDSLENLFKKSRLIQLNLLNDQDEIELSKRVQDILGVTHYFSFDIHSEIQRLSELTYNNIRLDLHQISFDLER